MKCIKLWVVVLFMCHVSFLHGQSTDRQLLQKVNLFMGTSGDHGQLTPAATVPFGMIKLAPQTFPGNQAGYDYRATKIRGFTHNRVEGTGCNGSGGNILVKPGFGEISEKPVSILKSTEKATPGYYELQMENGILSKFTVNNNTGWHQYYFPESVKNAWIMIDLSTSLDSLYGENHRINKDQSVSGEITAGTVCARLGGRYKLWHHIQLNCKIDSIVEKGHLVYFFFKPETGKAVNLDVTLSVISPEQALKDRFAGLKQMTFEQVKQQAEQTWIGKLSRIKVSGNEGHEGLFYTNLYRTFLSPVDITSSSGEYRGSDGKVYRADGFKYYTSWATWDNYRTQLPLLTIVDPEVMRDICRSIVALYKQGKELWATKTEPFPTVRTEHSMQVLLDAYHKGIRGFSLKDAYPGMIAELKQLPYRSPDQKLETSYDYWAIARIAKILGYADDEKKFINKAFEYSAVWNEKFKIMNAKSDVMHGDGLYEGTLWQYRWFVPFDIYGLIDKLAGKDEFTRQLAYFFDNNLYNHGNQPDIQAPFMFNYSGSPWMTQKIVNRLLTKKIYHQYGTHEKWDKAYFGYTYKNEPAGFIPEMDDDVGTMSAWYVLAAIGMYPVCPGEPQYALTTPIFNAIDIRMGDRRFSIRNKDFNANRFYIKSMRLNGKNRDYFFINHKEIADGGTLEYKLVDQPFKGK